VLDDAGTEIVGVLTVLPDGVRMPVRRGETMLAACRRYGYSFRVGCREGGCGDCALALHSGQVTYALPIAESVLSRQDRANGVCLPCRAVPRGDATISLNRSDRLARSPFADRFAARDLSRFQLEDRARPEDRIPGVRPSQGPGRLPSTRTPTSLVMPHDLEPQRPPGGDLKAIGTSMSSDVYAPTADSSTIFHEFEADLVVDRKEDVAEGVAALVLSDPSGSELPQWSAGAHIDVVLAGDDLTRQYSLCGKTRDRRSWRIGVLNAPNSRGGSRHIHEELAPGATLRVRGPRNHFALIDSPRYLFIAGGIGITPMLPMIAYAESIGAEWELVYGGRGKASMAFLDELEVFGDRVRLFPQDEAGHIPLASPSILGEPRADTLIYCCGPEPLLQAVEDGSGHWPSNSLHIERFAPKAAAPTAPGALETFEVVCQRSGLTLKVGDDRSILEVAEAAGLKVLASCRAGVCGTCEVDVIDGSPDHRDSVLSASERAENEFMLVCVSRSLSPRLVLDM
jgi:ferredoxin-NADP reductase